MVFPRNNGPSQTCFLQNWSNDVTWLMMIPGCSDKVPNIQICFTLLKIRYMKGESTEPELVWSYDGFMNIFSNISQSILLLALQIT